MRELKAEQLFEIEGELYRIKEGGLKVGTIIYDVRKQAFLEIETDKGLNSLACLAPEMYLRLEKI